MKSPDILRINANTAKRVAKLVLVLNMAYFTTGSGSINPKQPTYDGPTIRNSEFAAVLWETPKTSTTAPPEGVLIAPSNSTFHPSLWTKGRVRWAMQIFQSGELGPHQTPYLPR